MTNNFTTQYHFTKKTKMVDLLNHDYHILIVINRFGIKLGFGDNTIEKVCNEYCINIDFFLLIVNSFQNSKLYKTKFYPNIDVEVIIDYLQKTHSYYLNVIIPILSKLLNEVKVNSIDKTKEALLQRFYKQYIIDLKEHIDFEEKVVFPYIYMINAVYNKEVSDNEINDIDFRISNFKELHTNIEDKLFDLKNMLIKYYSMPDDEIVIHLLFLIYRFEKDIRDHALLEEKLLIPIVKKIEQSVFG